MMEYTQYSSPMITREHAMTSGCVHNLTKEVLKLSEGKDIVDRYYDVLMAAEILKQEMKDVLGR